MGEASDLCRDAHVFAFALVAADGLDQIGQRRVNGVAEQADVGLAGHRPLKVVQVLFELFDLLGEQVKLGGGQLDDGVEVEGALLEDAEEVFGSEDRRWPEDDKVVCGAR